MIARRRSQALANSQTLIRTTRSRGIQREWRAWAHRLVVAASMAALIVAVLEFPVQGQESGDEVSGDAATSAGSVDPTPVLSVRIYSSESRSVSGSFLVDIVFARPVSGFDVSGISLANGSVAGLTGSGAEYRATVTPAAAGTVVVWVPADVARDDAGRGNLPSLPFTRLAVAGGAGSESGSAGPGIDTWDRAAVLSEYRAEFDRAEPESGYTGNVEECVAGTTSEEFRDSILQRINWYRRMAGVHVVTEHGPYTEDAQAAALMMAAEDALSHEPDSSWKCYTAQGARAAGESNLQRRWDFWDHPHEGVGAIDGYMRDAGENNAAVGHRRWIFAPVIGRVGIGKGYTRFVTADALYVFDRSHYGRRPDLREVRDFVAWPPAGYVPAQAVWGRWSFTPIPHAEFSTATVTVVGDSGPVPVEIIHRETHRGFPHPAIVWAMDGDTDSAPAPEPSGGDSCYTVTVTGVKISGRVQQPYEYVTCLLDLSIEVADRTGLFAPQRVTASSVTDSSVTLSWGLVDQPNDVSVNSYIVERRDETGWSELHRSSTPLTRFRVDGLRPSIEYRFRIRLDTPNGDIYETITTTTADESTGLAVRIVARRLVDGRVEFALQARSPDGQWSRRLLPSRRFFPAQTTKGHWLVSTALNVSRDETSDGQMVRIVARRLVDGRVEFALQARSPDGQWSRRLLPSRRFFPVQTTMGHWLASTSLAVAASA